MTSNRKSVVQALAAANLLQVVSTLMTKDTTRQPSTGIGPSLSLPPLMDAAVTVRLPQGDKGTRTEAAADVTGEVRRHVPAFVERLLGAGEGLGDSAAVASELHGKEN